nr:Chain A, VAL-ALA-VAL-HIS-VAL-PHE [Homo sapiens]6C88_B Chain B, VAL-ALA-VAL-HIS-VAL-PHE [Homo sapiens]
VAVHVF